MANLIVFKGKPGVGKTSVSDALAKKLGYFIIHKDDINNIVFEAFGANKEASSLVYRLIEYFTRKLLMTGQNVVVDCSLSHRKNYELFVKLAKDVSSNLTIIEVVLSDESELESRLNTRADLPAHRIKTIEDIKKQGLTYEEYEIENLITVENNGDIEFTLNKLVERLSQ